MPKSTILIGSVSSPTLELSKNVGEPVGNHRWAVSGRIADASDMVSLLCAGVYLSLTHVKDGEGLTVDDFRFDDLDFHFLFPFLSFVFLSIAGFSDLSILNKCFLEAFATMVDESVFVFNLKTNGHPMSVIDDTGNLSSRIALAVEWNAVEFVAVSVKKVDEVGHDFLSFSFLSLTSYIDIIPKILELSSTEQMFF